MALTTETLRTLLIEYLGVDFGAEEVERLRPVIERRLERMKELRDLDLGGDDPRTMHYINDLRVQR